MNSEYQTPPPFRPSFSSHSRFCVNNYKAKMYVYENRLQHFIWPPWCSFASNTAVFEMFIFLLSHKVPLITSFELRNRGSYMSAHVLLNLLNSLRKRDKMLGAEHFISFSQRV